MLCLRDLSNYRDHTMPESPSDAKPASHPSPISPVTSQAMSTPVSRPLSQGPAGMPLVLNGAVSPMSGYNGRTPSPPSLMGSVANQQLPPACGARQLSKLKRFLTTLQQFGSDISPEIGERVRSLVLGLVNSHLSIEEFHAKLQEATNFPLRPFVIPFLKANLPLLQRELLHCARIAKQSPQQFLTHNEHILFDPNHTPLESQDLPSEVNENGKRRSSPDRPKENGLDSHNDPVHPAKRHHSLSPGSTTRGSPNGSFHLNTSGPIRLEDISLSREMRERERMERVRMEREQYERERHYTPNFSKPPVEYSRNDLHFEPSLDRIDDDWKHVETMLHCIIDMVGKTKRALAVLQERSARDREELAMWMRRQAEGLDNDVKKRTNEMMAHTMRQTEDRVSEVKRRAEEAVQEVKRQAVSELQKAVAAAEQKAGELVAAERAKMERAISDARKKAKDEVMAAMQPQDETSDSVSQSCWNCGRKASETCSGCNAARYCGSFCQHKDWERHHRVCGTQTQTSLSSGTQGEPPATVSEANRAQLSHSPVNVTSPVNSVGSEIQSGSRSSTPAESKHSESH